MICDKRSNEKNIKRCVLKELKLMLYLLRHKWMSIETLIFFKIQGIIKKYWDWSCIYHNRNEWWMKHLFSSISSHWDWNKVFHLQKFFFRYHVKLYLIKQKWTMTEILHFFKIVFFTIHYSIEFLIGQSTFEMTLLI